MKSAPSNTILKNWISGGLPKRVRDIPVNEGWGVSRRAECLFAVCTVSFFVQCSGTCQSVVTAHTDCANLINSVNSSASSVPHCYPHLITSVSSSASSVPHCYPHLITSVSSSASTVPHWYPHSQLIPLSRVPLNTYCRSAVQEIICNLCSQYSVPRATTLHVCDK